MGPAAGLHYLSTRITNVLNASKFQYLYDCMNFGNLEAAARTLIFIAEYIHDAAARTSIFSAEYIHEAAGRIN